VIWVYAVCDRPELPAPRRRGLADAPLDVVSADGLAAVFTCHAEAPSEPALDALWLHERVVESLMADRAVLPMRFGTKVGAIDGLTTALIARRSDLCARLERVRARVEIGVRVVVADGGRDGALEAAPPPAGPAPPSGRDYLLAKLGGVRAVREVGDELHAPLAARAVESRRRRPGPGEILRAAYLVERADVQPFVAAVDRARLAHRGVDALCTGPWPAYSFAAS
jgi:hypothetical protein